MRANRTYGSEGGEGESPSRPLYWHASAYIRRVHAPRGQWKLACASLTEGGVAVAPSSTAVVAKAIHASS